MTITRNPEYFLTIVQEGSISAAARKLYVSQPYLSRYLIRLEKELGTELFERGKKPIRLTEAGNLYKSYLESSEYLGRKFRSNLDEICGSRSETLHLGVGNWRGTSLMTALLPVYLQRHPLADIHLHEFPVSELWEMTEKETVDFTVMNTDINGLPETLFQEVIVHERIMLVVNPKTEAGERFMRHLGNGGEPDLRLLLNQRFISLDKSLTVGNHIDNYLSRNQLSFSGVLRTTSNWTALELVSRGLGFCFMVETGLKDSHLDPALSVVDLHSRDLMIPLAFVRRKNSYLSASAEDMMSLIREYYQNSCPGGMRPRTAETLV